MSPPASAPPTPERFFNVINSFHHVAVMKAAIELGVFTAIGQGHNSVEALSRLLKIHPRGARILLDHLVVLQFLTKTGNAYLLTDESALFLDQNSQAYIGGCVEFLLAPPLRHNFDHIKDRIRDGGAPPVDNTMMAPNADVWVRFARGMAGLMMLPAQNLARGTLATHGLSSRPIKVLDIAAGHGLFGIAFAQQHPQAHVTGLDWPNVLEVATDHAKKMGVADRYSTIAGNALTVDLGSGYDLVLLPNFLHHFSAAENTALLKRIHAALKPGGQVVIMEFAPNDDRVTPPGAAAFAMIMLAGTPAGDAYTVNELKQMLHDAGFSSIEWADVPMSMQRRITGTR